jgi:hypothetical protein
MCTLTQKRNARTQLGSVIAFFALRTCVMDKLVLRDTAGRHWDVGVHEWSVGGSWGIQSGVVVIDRGWLDKTKGC